MSKLLARITSKTPTVDQVKWIRISYILQQILAPFHHMSANSSKSILLVTNFHKL